MMRWLTLLLVCPFWAWGNDLSIDSLTIGGNDAVRFRISWQNSWNYTDSLPPYNHDGVWLVCKGRSVTTGAWEHLSVESAWPVSGTPLRLRTTDAGTGVLATPRDRGEGDIIGAWVELRMDAGQLLEAYGALQVFGMEMVHVPQGAFYVGDSASNNTLVSGDSRQPFPVTSEAPIQVGPGPDRLWSAGDFEPAGTVPAAFPKGFDGFYVMKYEISQSQYVAFLNTLRPEQVAENRLSTLVESPCFGNDHLDGERNFIVESEGSFGCDANGNGIWNEDGDGGDVACNFLTWNQLTAYLDWAGLRPMTELEYEKACRGGEVPLPLGFAWGTDQVVNTLVLSQTGTPQEHCVNEVPAGHGLANFGYCQPSGPLRCGFAAYQASGRIPAGASYYGLMEMSGNLWELCVALTTAGLAFDGGHGDGQLDPFGREDAWNWGPGAGGHRGGGWNSGILPGFRDLAVSDRFFAFVDPNLLTRGTSGGRGVLSQSALE